MQQEPSLRSVFSCAGRGWLPFPWPLTALPLAAAGYTVGERFIPLEPMHIIFNLAMSSECKLSALSVPAFAPAAAAATGAATLRRVIATAHMPPDAPQLSRRPADSFSTVDLAQLQFPAQYKVGWGAMPQTAALLSAGPRRPGALTRITLLWHQTWLPARLASLAVGLRACVSKEGCPQCRLQPP